MARFTGVDGLAVLAGGYNLHIKSWSLTINAAEHDVTAFASAGWKAWLTGLKDWSGSLEGFLDDTVKVELPGAAMALLTLTATAGRTFSGQAALTQVQPAVAVDGVGVVSFTFRGTDILDIG